MAKSEKSSEASTTYSRIDTAVGLGSFILTGLMVYYFFRPTTEFVLHYWPEPRAVFEVATRDMDAQARHWAEYAASGRSTGVPAWLVSLGSFLLFTLETIVGVVLVLILSAPIFAVVVGTMIAPQAAFMWIWNRMRRPSGPSVSSD